MKERLHELEQKIVDARDEAFMNLEYYVNPITDIIHSLTYKKLDAHYNGKSTSKYDKQISLRERKMEFVREALVVPAENKEIELRAERNSLKDEIIESSGEVEYYSTISSGFEDEITKYFGRNGIWYSSYFESNSELRETYHVLSPAGVRFMDVLVKHHKPNNGYYFSFFIRNHNTYYINFDNKTWVLLNYEGTTLIRTESLSELYDYVEPILEPNNKCKTIGLQIETILSSK